MLQCKQKGMEWNSSRHIIHVYIVYLGTTHTHTHTHTLQWSFNEAVGIATGSDYSVSSATLSDSGDYTCIAQNNRGQTQQSFTLTVTTEGDNSLAFESFKNHFQCLRIT